MEMIRKFKKEDMAFEYQVDARRFLPWDDLTPPFGGALCIVRPGTESLPHVNSPDDEQEIFICIKGEAVVRIDGEDHPISQGDTVYIERGLEHYVINNSDEEFMFYALWWNKQAATEYLENHPDK